MATAAIANVDPQGGVLTGASVAASAAASGRAAIACTGVTVRFVTDRRTVTALDNVSFAAAQGSFVTLLGPSGCGKSTLLRVVADLVTPSAGEVQVLGGTPGEARRRRALGFVFQDPALLPWRTAIENVALPLEVGGRPPRAPGEPTPSELLALVGLAGWENAYPHELSGGMRQRVSIARALVGAPQVLLMDEPFGALDEITRDHLNEELLKIWQETRTTILFVTHSIYEATFLGQEVLVLAANPGRVREIVATDLPADRSLDVRETDRFVKLAARLRHLLRAG
jgi:NitT/TauT family transport system ATP-binding protein